jgi:hypothetical protein
LESGFSQRGGRGFESRLLQRRVGCEPDLLHWSLGRGRREGKKPTEIGLTLGIGRTSVYRVLGVGNTKFA